MKAGDDDSGAEGQTQLKSYSPLKDIIETLEVSACMSAGVSPVDFRQNTDTWTLGMVSLIPQGMETEFQE